MVWGNEYFGWDITRKMVVLFGSIFNNMTVERFDKTGNETEHITVPIEYAAKEKMLARLQGDPALDRPYSALLPRMSFEIVEIQPDRERHLPTLNRKVIRNTADVNKFKYQYTATPVNIKFNLYIYTKNSVDGTRVFEQIVPFFAPDWTASVEIVPEIGETRDIPVIHDGTGFDDIYDGEFKTKRHTVWTLTFTMKTYYYGPIKNKPIIKFTDVIEYVAMPGEDRAGEPVEEVTMQPGLLANGSPTTDASLSVPYLTIDVNSDYGFAETVNRL